jgi:hypothetical protein
MFLKWIHYRKCWYHQTKNDLLAILLDILKGLSSENYLPIPSHVRGHLSVGAISYKIWDMVSQFLIIVHTSGSGLIFNPIMIFPIPLTQRLESRSNNGMNSFSPGSGATNF